MELKLPDINEIISKIIELKAPFDGKSRKIKDWLAEHRKQIKKNQRRIKCKSDENDIKILLSFLRDLLVRAIKGESGEKVYRELRNLIKSKQDLNEGNYRKILQRAKYRWQEDGVQVIASVVKIFAQEDKWDWENYFERAEKYHETDFQEDDLLKIKNVKFKVRDLALSSFNPNYVATAHFITSKIAVFDTDNAALGGYEMASNDLHVVRVITRVGLLNYGFDLIHGDKLEMGNNPANEKNYLFLHRLVHKLSGLTGYKYLPADLDRIFWHFGKSICDAKPECSKCSIKNVCLTGQYKR